MTTTTAARQIVHHSWVPYVAITAGAALLLKAVLIIGSGDKAADAPMAVLYLAGVLLAVVAAVGTGLRQRRGRRTLVAVGLVLLVLASVMVLTDAAAPLFEAFSDKAYVGDEGPIGLLGLILLGLGARSTRTEPV